VISGALVALFLIAEQPEGWDARALIEKSATARRAIGPVLEVQPGTASPGDLVLVKIEHASKVPSGEFDGEVLVFLPLNQGFVALVPVSVEREPGELRIEVLADDHHFTATVEVMAAHFRRRAISIARKFTSPSRAQKNRSESDSEAFEEAFDRDFEDFEFSENFAFPRIAEMTAPFGDERLINGKKQSQHFGLDLDGDIGDLVGAANDGEVVLARNCFASGNTVLIHHGGRLFTAYFHMSSVAVQKGQHVRQGAPLGKVGNTGRVTGPHLHWGVKLDGKWVNPVALTQLQFVSLPLRP
jgi:murein DD-endopeptidase MepM/ murein hydrolase activator NlpD